MPFKKKLPKKPLDLSGEVLCCSCIDLCVKDAKKSLKEKFFKTNSNFYIPNVHQEQAK